MEFRNSFSSRSKKRSSRRLVLGDGPGLVLDGRLAPSGVVGDLEPPPPPPTVLPPPPPPGQPPVVDDVVVDLDIEAEVDVDLKF